MDYDVVIVGSGPIGMACACSMAKAKLLRIALVDKMPLESISKFKNDGREIALTHESIAILKEIAVWDLINDKDISPLKSAKVFDGDKKTTLSFDINNSNVKALGYLVANNIIKKSLFEIVSNIDNVDIIANVSVENVINDADIAKVRLSDNREIKAKLIVAADSRFSTIRSKLGISSFTRDFSKVMIVTKMKHDKPHNNIALEYFNYSHTLAMLPLNNSLSSAVLTVSSNQVEKFLNLSEKEFIDFIDKEINSELGVMKQQGKRYSYALSGMHAKTFTSTRAAIIGDAAVAMHPVTAHGFNLGLRGQKILSDSVNDALDRNIDIGADTVLRDFEKKQIYLTRLMFFGTNGIVDLFTNDSNIAKKVRKIVINLADKFPPIKFLITKHLTSAKKSNLIPF